MNGPLDPNEVLEAVGDYPIYIDLFAGGGGVCRGVYRYPCARPACDVIGIDIDGSKAAKYPDTSYSTTSARVYQSSSTSWRASISRGRHQNALSQPGCSLLALVRI